ncbi:DedA family protein [bacterium]|nr:DedA family protein [bacterium]
MFLFRKLYDWVLHWAKTPYGPIALFLLAFSESSFFPIPPDILLLALCISVPKKSFKYALICSIGSVLGGVFGYIIGVYFFDLLGRPILELYNLMDKYEYIQHIYNKYDALAVGIAGFTPIPYKIFTIAAGVCKINFYIFVLASLISRSLRFFILAALIFKFGKGIKEFIEKYFNLLSIGFVVALIGGFWLIKIFLK